TRARGSGRPRRHRRRCSRHRCTRCGPSAAYVNTRTFLNFVRLLTWPAARHTVPELPTRRAGTHRTRIERLTDDAAYEHRCHALHTAESVTALWGSRAWWAWSG